MHIKTLFPGVRDSERIDESACGECQTSCQSACKTSCTVANQICENIAGRGQKFILQRDAHLQPAAADKRASRR